MIMKNQIEARFTSSLTWNNKELHVDTSNLDYIWVVDGVIEKTGCDPHLSQNEEIVKYFNELNN